MLVSINPVYVMRSKMINVCSNLLIQKRNKLAIGFLYHLQAHRNCTLLVGWFVYLLVVWDLKKQKNVLSNNWKGMLNLLGGWLRWKMVESWKLKNTGKINQIRENHRPMKINKQLRMLMLKREEKEKRWRTVANCCDSWNNFWPLPPRKEIQSVYTISK